MAMTTTSLALPACKLSPGCVALDFGGAQAKIAYFPNKTEASSALDALKRPDGSKSAARQDVLAQEPARKSVFIKPGSVSKLRVSYEKKADETMKKNIAATQARVTDVVCLATVPLGKEKDITALIQQNCDLPIDESNQRTVNVSGVGTLKVWNYLEKNLGVKLSMHDENSMTVRGFKHLMKHLGAEEFLQPYPDEVIEEAFKEQKATTAAILSLSGQSLPAVDEKASPRAQMQELFAVDLDVPEGLSKYLLVSLSSGAVAVKVDGDNIQPNVDVMNGVGKTFHGLGKLITGKQSYDDLVALAARGKSERVNAVMGDAVTSDSGAPDNLYNTLPEDTVSYFMGKVVDPAKKREDFAPEDLMAGLLEMICSNIVQRTYNVAVANDVSAVFLMGGFVDSAEVRDVLARLILRCWMSAEKKVSFHFTKYPNYIEVIGSLLTSIGTTKPAAAKKSSKKAVREEDEEEDADSDASDGPDAVKSGTWEVAADAGSD